MDWVFEAIINTEFLPPIEEPGDRVEYVFTLLTNGLVLLFAGVILLAIIYSLIAAARYIRSQGDSQKVDEAQAMLRYVLVGTFTLFLGVLMVLFIVGVFTDGRPEFLREAFCTFLEPDSDLGACIAAVE
ncbi:MAG: hypothetical protein ACOCXP_01195 [Candidatus Dojkabacteria bacterium]